MQNTSGESTAAQGQAERGRNGRPCLHLDHGGPQGPDLLLCAGTKPRDPEETGKTERASIPEASWKQTERLSGGRAGFPFSPAGETLRNRRVEAGDCLLQLPRPGGGEFLQRMPRVHQAEGGRPHHEPHGGDLLQRGPNMLPPQGERCFRTVPDGARAHAGKPPPKRRVERRALYLLGFKHRAEHGRCHPKRTCRMQGRTAGFSDMHGDPQDGGQVLRRTPGKRLCEGSFLYAPSHKQEHLGDSQIRAGQDSSVRRACQESGRPAQLHPGRGILRGWTGC